MATVESNIHLEPGDLSERQRERLKAWLQFQPNAETIVSVYKENRTTGDLWVPRGAWDLLPKKIQIRDKRSFPKLPRHEPLIELDFQSEDKKFFGQRECVNAMFNPKNNQQGFIQRQPGSGKSNICLYFIARVGTRSLVIVHTEDLLNQWLKYANQVLPTMDVGVVRQGREEVKQLTIAMLQTLNKRNFPEEWYRQFGAVINDECLHAPANTFDQVISKCTARYRFGVSASENRADNMQPLVDYLFGKKIHQLEFTSPVPVTVKKINSGFYGKSGYNRWQWQNMIKRLVNDEHRNKLIAKEVNKQVALGRSTLVLSRRIEHLQNLQALIPGSEVLAAKLLKKPERNKMIEDFREGKIKCILATQLADEGLDVPILACVALTFPAKHTDLILQQVGRALREHKGKDAATIIDVVDDEVKSLRNQWYHRRHAYRKWGFKIVGNGLRDRIVITNALQKPKVAFTRKRRNKKTYKFLEAA